MTAPRSTPTHGGWEPPLQTEPDHPTEPNKRRAKDSTAPAPLRPRVVALGNPAAGDDGAAIAALARLAPGPDAPPPADVVVAGRPGAGLLDLLDDPRPLVLVDVVVSGAAPGTLHRVPLADLPGAALARGQVSSHGFGPAEALELAAALGRPLPPGLFIGLEGAHFAPGAPLSPAVEAALPALARAIADALAALAAAAALPPTGAR